MRLSKYPKLPSNRRGIILVLSVILLVAVFAFVAFTVDTGHMAVVRAQLQAAADSAALGSAQQIPDGETIVRASATDLAGRNKAGGNAVTLAASDIELGFFDFAGKTFVVNPAEANAVRVTARVEDQQHFFAPIMGTDNFDMTATAIGMLNPRDIVFVVDLSGSMNDDTEPCWATDAITTKYTPLGFPTVGHDLMQTVFNDFGYGTFPGTVQYIGAPLGVAADNYAYAEMTKDDGPLTSPSLASTYRIDNSDDETVRRQKAYSWIIDHQIATSMPAAKPTPDSATNYDYWSKYIDYLMSGNYVGNPPPPTPPTGPPTPPTPPTPPPTGPVIPPPPTIGMNLQSWAGTIVACSDFGSAFNQTTAFGALPASPVVLPGCPRRGANDYIWLPIAVDGDRIHQFNNPNSVSFPSASAPWGWRNWIGYRTYVQFMMDWGRERSPELENNVNSNPAKPGKTPLSLLSADCPLHSEVTAGGTFQFPPRCEPMHSVRRSLIAAINLIKTRNNLVTAGAGDRVSIVTYDGDDGWHEATIIQTLTDDYDAAMLACTKLQASADIGATTATESGVALAREHLRAKTLASNPTNAPKGPQGRKFTSKVMVLLTDGMPNVWDMSTTDIGDHIAANASPNYYPTGYHWFNSVLVQSDQFFKDQRGKLFPLGMGLAADYDFMDRLARQSSTDMGGLSLHGSGNPAAYEAQLINMLTNVINRAGSRLAE